MAYHDEIDIPSAKERFLGNEALYKKFLYRLPQQTLFADLEKFVEEENAEEAFKAAHTLKGVAGNLSLNTFLGVLHGTVEKLRGGELPSDEERTELKEAYYRALEAIAEVQEGDKPLF